MSEVDGKVLCYNRGCGKRFNPEKNKPDSCVHHPGAPFFHDAYKGWSCCKKKCTDFTEFLNIKGCTRSAHNPVKPPEPEKPVVDKSKADEIIEYKAPQPLKPTELERPPFESPLIRLKSTISPSMQQELNKTKEENDAKPAAREEAPNSEVEVGALCKNGGCKATYVDESSNGTECVYHPGVPIFHEGLKYWTCCTRRTTDFQAFLNQEGCATGNHSWRTAQDVANTKTVKCRQDWMQTGTHVVVNVYCKKYDPTDESATYVEVNPIRLKIRIHFPNGTPYFHDMELRGMIDPLNSSVLFTPSKVEIKLRKAEPMSWNRLENPRPVADAGSPQTEKVKEELPRVDVIDLSDL